MLKKYRDIFRIKLGNDLTANVPPLVITIVDKTKSHHSLNDGTHLSSMILL